MGETGKRRSDRVLISMPVSVSGTDAAGKPFSENTTTVTVSQHGASIALKSELIPGQEITLRRQRSSATRVAECRVAGRIGKQAGLEIFAVAFQKPAIGFWDIYFPCLPADTEIAARALLGCKVCGTRQIVHLDPEKLAVYNANRQLSLNCPKCGKTTIWSESEKEAARQPELRPANLARLAVLPSPQPSNQRKHRRVAAEVPVCIRQAGSDDDLVTAVDISHGGMSFTSNRHYVSGSFLQVAIPYSTTAVNVFLDARVVHSSKVPSAELYRVGIMYLAENEPASE